MKRLCFLACLLATPAFAQVPPPDVAQAFVSAYTTHKSSIDVAQGTTREVEQAADALLKAYQDLKTENETLKAAAAKLKAATPVAPN